MSSLIRMSASLHLSVTVIKSPISSTRIWIFSPSEPWSGASNDLDSFRSGESVANAWRGSKFVEEIITTFKRVSCQVQTALESGGAAVGSRRLVAGAACLPVPDELLVAEFSISKILPIFLWSCCADGCEHRKFDEEGEKIRQVWVVFPLFFMRKFCWADRGRQQLPTPNLLLYADWTKRIVLNIHKTKEEEEEK